MRQQIGNRLARTATLSLVATLGAALAITVQGTRPSGGETRQAAPPAADKAAAYGNLPLGFEPNVGQVDTQADFLARGSDHALLLNSSTAVLSVAGDRASGGAGATIGMRFVGSNPSATPAALEPLPGKVNSYTGGDPSRHHSAIPTFGRVAYRDVYPGVDVAYYGTQRELEYDVVVKPRADPAAVHLAFDGATGVRVEAGGDLVVSTPAGDVRHGQPVAYQQISGQRQVVPGRFVVDGGQVSFSVGAYDHTRPLVIDPTIAFSTLVGGTSVNFSEATEGLGVAVDRVGNAYLTGWSCAFPTTPGAPQPTFAGGGCPPNGGDAYVAKFSADGRHLLYATYLGGPDRDVGTGIAVDPNGFAYVKGTTSGGFPTTAGAFRRTLPNPQANADFVTKLTPSGALAYSTYFAEADDLGHGDAGGIAIDASGHAYITGSVDRPGVSVAYVAKLNPTGSGLVYRKLLGGRQNSRTGGFGITVDSAGRAYIEGHTDAVDLPTTPGAAQPTYGGGVGDLFVAELSADGAQFLYVTYLGGNLLDSAGVLRPGNDIALGPNNLIYAVGATRSFNFPTTPGAFQTKHEEFGFDEDDATLTVINPAGHGRADIVYSTYFGANQVDSANGVVVDAAGRAYIVGTTLMPRFDSDFSNNFPLVDPLSCCGTWVPDDGNSQAFVSEINPAGRGSADLLFSTFLGGTERFERNVGTAISFGPDGSVYVTGRTLSANFPTTPNAFQRTKLGLTDAFVTKIFFSLACTPANTITGDIVGPLTVAPGPGRCLQNVRLAGDLVVQPGAAVSIVNSQISGAISSDGPIAFTLCGTLAAHGVTVANATGPVLMGDTTRQCAGNRIAGDATLTNNVAGVDVGDNQISGTLTVDATRGQAQIQHNNIHGTLACSGNVPDPTDNGRPNTAGGRTGQCSSPSF
jgi:hypothetical protein